MLLVQSFMRTSIRSGVKLTLRAAKLPATAGSTGMRARVSDKMFTLCYQGCDQTEEAVSSEQQWCSKYLEDKMNHIPTVLSSQSLLAGFPRLTTI